MLLIEMGNGMSRSIGKECISLRALRVAVQLERLCSVLVGSASEATAKATANLMLICILSERLLVVLLLIQVTQILLLLEIERILLLVRGRWCWTAKKTTGAAGASVSTSKGAHTAALVVVSRRLLFLRWLSQEWIQPFLFAAAEQGCLLWWICSFADVRASWCLL